MCVEALILPFPIPRSRLKYLITKRGREWVMYTCGVKASKVNTNPDVFSIFITLDINV